MAAPRRLINLVDTYPNLSETFIERENEEMRRQGVEVEIVALRGSENWRLRQGRVDAALVRAILKDSFSQPRRCLTLLRHAPQIAALSELLERRPDAVLLAQFAWTPADVARLAARRVGRSFAVRVHAWDVFTRSPRALWQCLDSATSVIGCSQAVVEAVKACGYPAEQTHLVHHGLPLDEDCWNWREPVAGCRMVGVGRLVPKKGIDLLIRACVELSRQGVDYEVEWIGDGPLRNSLERQLAAAGPAVVERFRFAGALTPDETRHRLQTATLLVLPSRRLPDGDRDGIANVLIEAAALGVPLVTTTAGSASEVFRDGESARLVPPDDVAALAAALKDCLADAALRKKLAAAARLVVERQFDLTRNTANLLQILAPLNRP